MSVKLALLALLDEEPQGVYSLRNRFQDVTGGSWPLNIGQVYSTVQRLERDDLIAHTGTEPSSEEGRPDVDIYSITTSGKELLHTWWKEPVDRSQPQRDEFTIKVALALSSSHELFQQVIDIQRFSLLRSLQAIHRQHPGNDSAAQITTERQKFLLEAELKWLDHIQLAEGNDHD